MLWFWTGFTLSFFYLRMAKGEVNYNPQNFARWLLGIRAECQNWHAFKIWEDLATAQENAAFPSKVNLEFGASCEFLLMWNSTWALSSQQFQLWKRGCDMGPLRHNFSTWTVISFLSNGRFFLTTQLIALKHRSSLLHTCQPAGCHVMLQIGSSFAQDSRAP